MVNPAPKSLLEHVPPIAVNIAVVVGATILYCGVFSFVLHLWAVWDIIAGYPLQTVLQYFVKPVIYFLIGSMVLVIVFFSCRNVSRGRHAVSLVVALVLFLAYAFVPLGPSGSEANEFGLISFAGTQHVTVDYSSNTAKDNYPVCTFDYNSHGFRSKEPPPVNPDRTRVLMIGDSFIWGDGIATNDNTISSLLQKNLDSGGAGKYDVMQAAYPGLGLFGYTRFVGTLAPLYEPDIVIIGYLGEADQEPFDAQFLMDYKRDNRLIGVPLIRFGVLQNIHETSAGLRQDLAKRNESTTRNHFSRLEQLEQEYGMTIILLHYFADESDRFAGRTGLRSVKLPRHLRYPNRRTDLWYAKDCHPRVPLNRKLAHALASALRAGAPGGFEESAFDRELSRDLTNHRQRVSD